MTSKTTLVGTIGLEQRADKLPIRQRIFVITGSALGSWMMLGAVGVAVTLMR